MADGSRQRAAPSSEPASSTDRRPSAAPPWKPGIASTCSPVERLLMLQRTAGNAVASRVARDIVVQRKAKSVAKIIDSGISVSNARGNAEQLGHAMDVWVKVDAGADPVTPPSADPNTVYGLGLEYWEYAEVPHDNMGTAGIKPWNDIYAMKPDASTFRTDSPGCDLNWDKAVKDARTGELKGKKRIGFRDIPGLWDATSGLHAKPGRNTERTLKFRIVFDDGEKRREIYATQVLRVNNGALGYSAYKDSMGNKLEAHGFGSDNYRRGGSTEKQQLRNEPNRLKPARPPSTPEITARLPQEAMTAVATFVAQTLQGKALPFVDKELAQFVKLVPKDRQAGAADNWQQVFTGTLRGDLNENVAAGQFLLPTIPGTNRYQYALPSGGLLVALARSNAIPRMYYTDNSATAVSLNVINQLSDKNWSVNLRSFAEIPPEIVRESVSNDPSTKVAVGSKTVKLKTDDGHEYLHPYTRHGQNYLVDPEKAIGKKIENGADLQITDPEVRDVTGQWVQAQHRGKTGFLHLENLEGAGSNRAWERKQKGTHDQAEKPMEVIFQDYFDRNGAGHQAYSQLVADYPGFETEIATTYKTRYGADEYHKMELDRDTAKETLDVLLFQLSAQQYDGDHPRMTLAVMEDLKNQPGRGDRLESVYNQQIAPDYDVPATLGEIVNTYFKVMFKRRGKGFDVYNELLTDYPDFAYRLKPAYREVHGEKELQAMLQARDQDRFSADVPNPNSLQNTTEYLDFATQTYSVTDFVPATKGKFNATYNPMTGDLDITVKVHYLFKDEPNNAPEDLAGEDPQFSRYFGSKTWTDPEKNEWKTMYASAATDSFNKAGKKIVCQRPGWEDIVAKPRFIIEEVDAGEQHFVIAASKAVLTKASGTKQLRAGGSSGAGSIDIGGGNVPSVLLQEQDVYDKFKDPRLHTYLHQGETTGNVEPAYLLDRRRLEEVLQRLGTIDLGAEATKEKVQAAMRNLADALQRLSIPSSLATLHPLLVSGTAATMPEAQKAAQLLVASLTRAGVTNPTEEAAQVGPSRTVSVAAKPPDDNVRATYVTNWHRYTAAHEFGHQIGLIDEYYGAASGKVVKAMISAGWLPPDTRADHLRLHPPTSRHLTEAESQELMIALWDRAGLESPDFAMDAPNTDPKSTSLMTGGFDVRDIHFITAWEALVTMTKGHVDEMYWKIV